MAADLDDQLAATYGVAAGVAGVGALRGIEIEPADVAAGHWKLVIRAIVRPLMARWGVALVSCLMSAAVREAGRSLPPSVTASVRVREDHRRGLDQEVLSPVYHHRLSKTHWPSHSAKKEPNFACQCP